MDADYGVGSWPARRARISPHAVAMRQDGRVCTYAELAARVEKAADALAQLGVGRGDRVAYLGANDIVGFEVFFAAGRLGAIFVPLNTRLTTVEIGYLVGNCAPAALVHTVDLAELASSVDTEARRIAVTGTGSDGYESLLQHAPARHGAHAAVGLSDDAVILYTSGTTGHPKGAVLTHGNLTFNMMNQLAHADVLSTDTALCISPLFHATGLGQVSLPTLFKGGTVIVVAKFDSGAVLQLIAEHRVNSFSGVPTTLKMLCDHEDFERTDLSSLRYVIYGGSMVPERVALAWQKRGVILLQGYGMTEASPGVYMAPADGAQQRPVSVGVPHFYTDVTFDPAAADEPTGTGELLVRGPTMFSRYWDQPQATADAYTEGWYRSGDVLRIDDDGWAYVVDRIKDMIISGGENIYPAEVETAINMLPGVTDSAVIAVPDERWGEVGHAFVITVATDWTTERLRTELAHGLAAYKIPKYVTFVDDLPRTATGKVRKDRLRSADGLSD